MRTQRQITSIRSNSPLTLDQIRNVVPSAFATQPYNRVSSRYAYIPTEQVIRGMMANGFAVYEAGQSRSRLADKQAHTRHMIRFRSNTDVANQAARFAKIGDTPFRKSCW